VRPDAISRLATRKVPTRAATMTGTGQDVRKTRRARRAWETLPSPSPASAAELGATNDSFEIMPCRSFSCEYQESPGFGTEALSRSRPEGSVVARDFLGIALAGSCTGDSIDTGSLPDTRLGRRMTGTIRPPRGMAGTHRGSRTGYWRATDLQSL